MVSVIIPLFNAEKYIKDTLYSVLNQSYQDFEILVIDDCGTDRSISIVEQIKDNRIRIIHNNRNLGIAESRNIGIDQASGEYIAFLDDDDIATMERLEQEIDFIKSHNDIDVVCSDMRFLDDSGKPVIEKSPMDTYANPFRTKAELIFHDVVPNGSAFIKKDFILRNNLRFKDKQYGMEDYRFWTECAAVGKISSVGNVLLYWRLRSDNETNIVLENQADCRRRVFRDIQKNAIQKYGFELNECEVETFCNSFTERNVFQTVEQLKRVQLLLMEMIHQAEVMDSQFYNAFSFCAKRQFARLTEKSEIWDI
jgi:glycosyltransferase involved in cell wall biosynthesis